MGIQRTRDAKRSLKPRILAFILMDQQQYGFHDNLRSMPAMVGLMGEERYQQCYGLAPCPDNICSRARFRSTSKREIERLVRPCERQCKIRTGCAVAARDRPTLAAKQAF